MHKSTWHYKRWCKWIFFRLLHMKFHFILDKNVSKNVWIWLWNGSIFVSLLILSYLYSYLSLSHTSQKLVFLLLSPASLIVSFMFFAFEFSRIVVFFNMRPESDVRSDSRWKISTRAFAFCSRDTQTLTLWSYSTRYLHFLFDKFHKSHLLELRYVWCWWNQFNQRSDPNPRSQVLYWVDLVWMNIQRIDTYILKPYLYSNLLLTETIAFTNPHFTDSVMLFIIL